MSAVEENIQVIVRCRPPNPKELLTAGLLTYANEAIEYCSSTTSNPDLPENKANNLVVRCCEDRKKLLLQYDVATSALSSSLNSAKEKEFNFNHVFCPKVGQLELYEKVVNPLVESAMEGYSATIFAYGATGSGKTHTVLGEVDDLAEKGGHRIELGNKAGLIQRICDEIFLIDSDVVVEMSYLEIYNEQIYDLQNDCAKIPDNFGSLDKNVVKTKYNNFIDLLRAIVNCAKKRKTKETKLNVQSSRSHTYCQISINQKVLERLVFRGSLKIVDLAGSENIARSGAEGETKLEGKNINTSLLEFGKYIRSLNEKTYVSARGSKLTRLLQDSFGGKTKTLMIATISPDVKSAGETFNTLNFAKEASFIVNKPTATEFTKDMVRVLQEQVEEMKMKNEHSVPASFLPKIKDYITKVDQRKAGLEQRLGMFANSIVNELQEAKIMAEMERSNDDVNMLEETIAGYFDESLMDYKEKMDQLTISFLQEQRELMEGTYSSFMQKVRGEIGEFRKARDDFLTFIKAGERAKNNETRSIEENKQQLRKYMEDTMDTKEIEDFVTNFENQVPKIHPEPKFKSVSQLYAHKTPTRLRSMQSPQTEIRTHKAAICKSPRSARAIKTTGAKNGVRPSFLSKLKAENGRTTSKNPTLFEFAMNEVV